MIETSTTLPITVSKSNDGAETAGSDGTSLHGFCEEWIDDLISSFRDESYQPQPNRITYIPRKTERCVKLSFPNGKDKLVQECNSYHT